MTRRVRSGPRAVRALYGAARSTTASYGQIWFTRSHRIALVFLAATLLEPAKGIAGLLCLGVTHLTARILGFEEERIQSGEFGLNGLLVGLSLAAIYQFNLRLLVLVLMGGIIAAVLTRAISGFLGPVMGLPAMSLPFVLGSYALYLAARSFLGLQVASWTLPFVTEDVLSGPIPFFLVYLQSLGAVLLQKGAAAGALVFLGLLLASRIATLLSLIGFTSGVLFYQFLGASTADITYDLIGFNFILTAMALGGIFVVPSLGSYLLAAVAAALCAALGCGFKALLVPYNLPVLALPFNFTVLLVLYCLKNRRRGAGLELVDFSPGSPEQNLAFARTRLHRLAPGEGPPWLLPVRGEWKVSQGCSGPHTHQGAGALAWDFVMEGEDGQTFEGSGARVEEYRAYGLPALAPGAGQVIKVVSHHPDVPVGAIDAGALWGNHLVLQHAAGIYSTLAHFQPEGIQVNPGQQVVAGQILGLVGSSGRSPEPHLHAQFQTGPEPTSSTLPASFGPLLIRRKDHWELLRRHVPEEGDVLSTLVPPEDRFSFPLRLGEEMSFEVRLKNGKNRGRETRWIETWRVGADLGGNLYIQEDRHGGQAFFRFEEGVFLMVDFLGSPRSALRAFFLGATMISLDDRPSVRWRDRTPAKHLLPGILGLIQFVTSPLLAVWTLETDYRFAQERRMAFQGGEAEVRILESEIRRGGPWSSKPKGEPLRSTRIVLSPQLGPLQVEARGKGYVLHAERKLEA